MSALLAYRRFVKSKIQELKYVISCVNNGRRVGGYTWSQVPSGGGCAWSQVISGYTSRRYSPRKVHTKEGTHQGRYTTWVGTPPERYTPGTDI